MADAQVRVDYRPICRICNKKLMSYGILEEHLIQKHGYTREKISNIKSNYENYKKIHNCPRCSYTTHNGSSNLYAHIFSMHTDEANIVKEEYKNNRKKKIDFYFEDEVEDENEIEVEDEVEELLEAEKIKKINELKEEQKMIENQTIYLAKEQEKIINEYEHKKMELEQEKNMMLENNNKKMKLLKVHNKILSSMINNL